MCHPLVLSSTKYGKMLLLDSDYASVAIICKHTEVGKMIPQTQISL